MASKRLKSAALVLPENLAQAAAVLGEIRKADSDIEILKARHDAKVAGLKAELAAKLAPLNALVKEQFNILKAWAAANRKQLLKGGSKTYKLLTGRLSWRYDPVSCVVDDEAAAIAALKKAGLKRFIRVKEEVDKAAILADRKAVAGIEEISFKRVEQFVARANESDIEHIARKTGVV